jgi:hypothetical protein
MDATGRLRRTVRRCTAVLVASIGVTTWAGSDLPTADYGSLLGFLALLYLIGSLVYDPAADSERDASTE